MIFNVMEAVTPGRTSCSLAGLLSSQLHICHLHLLDMQHLYTTTYYHSIHQFVHGEPCQYQYSSVPMPSICFATIESHDKDQRCTSG